MGPSWSIGAGDFCQIIAVSVGILEVIERLSLQGLVVASNKRQIIGRTIMQGLSKAHIACVRFLESGTGALGTCTYKLSDCLLQVGITGQCCCLLRLLRPIIQDILIVRRVRKVAG
jgi:hypothetical protein